MNKAAPGFKKRGFTFGDGLEYAALESIQDDVQNVTAIMEIAGADYPVILAGGGILKARVLADEGQVGHPVGAVSLLTDDELGLALLTFGQVLVVDRVTIDEDDDVGILLDGA